MTVHGLIDRATLTSICGSASDGGEFCGSTGDRFDGELPVRSGDQVRVRLRPGAGRVGARLRRLRGNDEIAEWIDWGRRATEVKGSDGRRWRFELPRDLEDASAIHLFVSYSGGVPYPGGYTVRQATCTSRVVAEGRWARGRRPLGGPVGASNRSPRLRGAESVTKGARMCAECVSGLSQGPEMPSWGWFSVLAPV